MWRVVWRVVQDGAECVYMLVSCAGPSDYGKVLPETARGDSPSRPPHARTPCAAERSRALSETAGAIGVRPGIQHDEVVSEL